jgi:REP element-mobilizing transposase RayT
MPDQLRRLPQIWIAHPIYFITTCTKDREHRLNEDRIHGIVREVWKNCEQLQHWFVGRYVLMPDHVHFFCAPGNDATDLSQFVGKWKEWTAKYAGRRLQIGPPLWQPEFFDHVLRSSESYEQKWQYSRMNPVRAGFVSCPDDWPYQDEINDLRFDH